MTYDDGEAGVGVSAIPVGARLTPTQDAVLRRLATGISYQQLAYERGCSYQTIKNHCMRIYTKLEVHTLVEAMNAYGLVCHD